ncbi:MULTISPECIES: cytochrome b [Alphaproteobacteria]|uniref:Cytochrome b n=2 Tax=Alphaproteobacteria TaxID=28211 RepID=A0A512HJZ7_9HYPH|nr:MULTISPECIES: cytochrome b/b6 domain-containing protein [Alphaproteobacteria]GEO85751.1 cytochrome b [Ciceribacter naphthalenivorans]GLR21889.1 cytochrome b [Ciceribacter naphthalenivorans]GLT04745.1 cytochrome b [Sphingomonas psychrolutea]
MSSSPVLSYSIPQRLIHWLMAGLIFFNLIFTEGMEELTEAAEEGQTPSADMIASANIHAYVGIGILCLAVLRLILRLTHGAPEAPADEPPVVRLVGKIVHGTFYLLFLVMPAAGIAAYYFGIGTAGELHAGPMKLLMWVLIVLHVGAVLVHQFVWKTPVIQRMTKG